MSELRSTTLARQVRKHLPPELIRPCSAFLEAMDAFHTHYEQDRAMIMRAMELSSEELHVANQGLRSHNEFLETFSYGTAHDLKNHAINVSGMVAMLRKQLQTNDPRVPTTIDHLERASRLMQNTVQDLLMIAKILSDENASSEPITPAELRSLVEAECAFIIGQGPSTLLWELPQETQVLWPKEPFRTALVNLVSNALKYKHVQRDARVNVRLTNTKEALELCVTDNGRGIDLKTDGHRLFKMFSRLSSSRDQEGSGVGLFVVKKLVERKRGTMTVDSVPNEWTSVKISIPNAA